MKRLLILQIIFILLLPLKSFGNIGNDATSFNPLTVHVKAKSIGVPIGTVIAWPSNTSPPYAENWLNCDGRSISRSAYPELYAITGSTLPDYEGMFLRGLGGDSAGLGVEQNDAMRRFSGDGHSTFEISPGENTTVPTSGAFVSKHLRKVGSAWYYQFGTRDIYEMSLDLSKIIPSTNIANENRPVNKAVRYLIRAK